MGFLATTVLTGDAWTEKRNMKRVVKRETTEKFMVK